MTISTVRTNSSAPANARKLVIKPFKVQPKIPENFEQETWGKLKSAVHDVFSKSSSKISKEELYRVSEMTLFVDNEVTNLF